MRIQQVREKYCGSIRFLNCGISSVGGIGGEPQNIISYQFAVLTTALGLILMWLMTLDSLGRSEI